ncbi:hypothetical protein EYF80_010114 [Liparis tanakae]|uniref:Uncharacterized protein n=1 Tax=Liparis tanakae TaxID=230148 RepID=A0A4Z2IQN1_9TELE|nr:hypothetical protein EYF80_010114 [Liparis tanakae]
MRRTIAGEQSRGSWPSSAFSLSSSSRAYWQRRSSCCRAMAMRRDRLCMQLMTDGPVTKVMSANQRQTSTTIRNVEA